MEGCWAYYCIQSMTVRGYRKTCDTIYNGPHSKDVAVNFRLLKVFFLLWEQSERGAFGGVSIHSLTHNQTTAAFVRVFLKSISAISLPWAFDCIISSGRPPTSSSRRRTEIDWITTNYVIKSKTFPPFSLSLSLSLRAHPSHATIKSPNPSAHRLA